MRHHYKRVISHQKQSNKSLSIFTNLVQQLKKQNMQLDDAIRDMDDDIERLKSLKVGAHMTMLQNTKSIDHIAKIVGE